MTTYNLKVLLFSLMGSFCLTAATLADSPLTSTGFREAYSREPIVMLAVEANGILTLPLMEYLASPGNPIDVKMAVINGMGWDVNGKKNSQLYYAYLEKTYGYKNQGDFLDNAPGEMLLGMAYLKALDNYFAIDDALSIAEHALQKNRNSYTFNIIAALIRAQKMMYQGWQKVYQVTNNVRKDTGLVQDMNPEAVAIIFDYLDLYNDTFRGL
jgi:hypothetical protein